MVGALANAENVTTRPERGSRSEDSSRLRSPALLASGAEIGGKLLDRVRTYAGWLVTHPDVAVEQAWGLSTTKAGGRGNCSADAGHSLPAQAGRCAADALHGEQRAG